jgi:endonuclease/exonuclease/phosphatase family metal-dependent hydrolase
VHVRVVTFNIHHGTVGEKGPVDPDQLGEVCAGFDADVIALQEVDNGTWRSGRRDLAAIVARGCGMQYVFGPASRFWGGWYGNALLVRGEILRSTVTPLPRVPRCHRWQERRSVLAAEVSVEGHRWSVLNTHLAVPESVNGPQLDEVLALAAAQPQPIVVLGDFNHRPSFTGFTQVEHGPTYPAAAPVVWLDHVLASAGVRVGAVEVRSTAMSDHAALLVDLTAQTSN